MKARSIFPLMMATLPLFSLAQKRIVSIPFEFEKKFLDTSEYDAYFLPCNGDTAFSLVLRDNKKAQYLLFDKNLKQITKFDEVRRNTVFHEDIMDYRGGTNDGNIYRFLYEEKEQKAFSKPITSFQLETVDFAKKSVYHSKLFEIPKSERLLCAFSDFNVCYTITADDKAGELVLYTVSNTGTFKERRISFTVPASAGKKRDKLSEYFTWMQVFRNGEEPDLSAAVSSAKLFSTKDNLHFVINNGKHPVHLFTIKLPTFTSQEKFIELGVKGEKFTVNSFLKNDRLYSLILEKDVIRVTVHDLATRNLQKQYEIDESFNMGMFAGYPVTEKRMGKRESLKDVDDIKKLIKSLDKGSEGIMVSENGKRQLILTIGTYDPIRVEGVDPRGGQWKRQYFDRPSQYNTGPVMVQDYRLVFVPGQPVYTTIPARYYNTTYFRIILDSTAGKMERVGRITPVTDQIKDYIEGIGPKVKATNQFAIGERQFYGYYDRDAKAYVVDEIRIRPASR